MWDHCVDIQIIKWYIHFQRSRYNFQIACETLARAQCDIDRYLVSQVTPYGNTDLGEVPKWWFVIWRHQAITWISAYLT